MAIEKDFFRQVMGQFATGVTVVTTQNKGTLAGITVNAFCSVSLDPFLILVCVDRTSVTLPHIRESGVFAVNILTEQQERLSRCFALPSTERYEHFCYADYHSAATGAPILDSTLAFIDARVVAEYPGGDHIIFLGQVEALGAADQVAFAHDTNHTTLETVLADTDEEPLAYYQGKYRHLTRVYRQPSLSTSAAHEKHHE